jgi:hypothetical protein
VSFISKIYKSKAPYIWKAGEHDTKKHLKALSQKMKAKQPPDPRHVPFKEVIFRFYRWKWGRDPQWDGAEGNQLSRLLKSDPKLDERTFAVWLRNYGNSEDIAPGERPCMFLPKISRYSVVALDRYGRNGNGESKDAALARKNREVLERLRSKAGATDESGAPILEGIERGSDGVVGRNPRKLLP